jgi:cbb3-type cytochrome oxidase maturation protein
MNILLVLIPLTILLGLGAVIAFFWAVDHDQFDDLDTPKLLPLLDDPQARGQDGTRSLLHPGKHGDEAKSRGDTRKAMNDDDRRDDGDSKRLAHPGRKPRT